MAATLHLVNDLLIHGIGRLFHRFVHGGYDKIAEHIDEVLEFWNGILERADVIDKQALLEEKLGYALPIGYDDWVAVCHYGALPEAETRAMYAQEMAYVESLRDVFSIENTGQYNGLYHILGGIISPMDGIGPSDLPIASLVSRISSGDVREVVLALSTSMEGETTSFYIFRQISGLPVKVTAIARGVGFGDDLEYTDEMTLGRSIQNRQLFQP